MAQYTVIAPLMFVVVEAASPADAVQVVLEGTGHPNKPWLARDWEIRVSTHDDLVRYATEVDALQKSQTVAAQASRTKKNMKERLL